MAWELKDKERGIFLVAPTELQLWILFFGVQGKCFDGQAFFDAVVVLKGLGELEAVEIPS